METTKIRLTIPSKIDPAHVTGPSDANLRALEGVCGARIVLRGDGIALAGTSDELERLTRVFTQVFKSIERGRVPGCDEVVRMYEALLEGAASADFSDDILLTYRGRAIRPKTAGQKRYIDAIRSHTITFGLGPAGTGKTYLAMALALSALKRHEIGRIVLTRPVVEAGESLGYLPGTLEEKIDPYVRPLLDALFDLTDMERANEYLERGLIEIAPLAYMRGRTLNDAFVILDEAQNTTPEQMKMFLTRLGFNSKFIVTGDASQRDLPGRIGGLSEAERILGGIEDISFVHLGRGDVVRHQLVGEIVEAYDAFEAARPDARRRREGEGHGRSHQ